MQERLELLYHINYIILYATEIFIKLKTLKENMYNVVIRALK